MNTEYHNLSTIKGVGQRHAREFAGRGAGYEVDDDHAQLSLEIAQTYLDEAGVKSWVRTVRLNRDREATVTDAYELAEAAGELKLSLMTPCKVSVDGPGRITLTAASDEAEGEPVVVRLDFDADKLTPTVEDVFATISEPKLEKAWGQLRRIRLTCNSDECRGTLEARFTIAGRKGQATIRPQ